MASSPQEFPRGIAGPYLSPGTKHHIMRKMFDRTITLPTCMVVSLQQHYVVRVAFHVVCAIVPTDNDHSTAAVVSKLCWIGDRSEDRYSHVRGI